MNDQQWGILPQLHTKQLYVNHIELHLFDSSKTTRRKLSLCLTIEMIRPTRKYHSL
jgi:hypothetical protein